MNKKLGILAVLAVLSLSLFLSVAFAQAQGFGDKSKFPWFIREELKDVFDNGTYDDLVALRDKYHKVFIPWVDEEEDFEVAADVFDEVREYRQGLRAELRSVFEEGTYDDLAAMRDEYNQNFVAWIQDEEDFELGKEVFQRRGEFYDENGHPGAKFSDSFFAPLMH